MTESPVTDHAYELRSAEQKQTIYDTMFRIVCMWHGVSTGHHCTWAKRMYRAVVALRTIVLICLLLASFRKKSDSGAEMSIALFFSESAIFMLEASGIFLPLFIVAQRKHLRSLFRRNGRCFHDVLIPPLCSVTYLVSRFDIPQWGSDLISDGEKVLLLHAQSCLVGIFIMYNDVIGNLKRRNQEILRAIRSGKHSLNTIAAKWEIRDAIAKANSLFARIIAAYYIQFFACVIYTVAMMTQNEPQRVDKSWLFINTAFVGAQLFDVARRSSILTPLSLQIEFELVKRIQPHPPAEMAILRFREEWDVLQVSVFAHSAANFLRFLGSTITCAAIILQFDYKVVRTLNIMGVLFAESVGRNTTDG